MASASQEGGPGGCPSAWSSLFSGSMEGRPEGVRADFSHPQGSALVGASPSSFSAFPAPFLMLSCSGPQALNLRTKVGMGTAVVCAPGLWPQVSLLRCGRDCDPSLAVMLSSPGAWSSSLTLYQLLRPASQAGDQQGKLQRASAGSAFAYLVASLPGGSAGSPAARFLTHLALRLQAHLFFSASVPGLQGFAAQPSGFFSLPSPHLWSPGPPAV